MSREATSHATGEAAVIGRLDGVGLTGRQVSGKGSSPAPQAGSADAWRVVAGKPVGGRASEDGHGLGCRTPLGKLQSLAILSLIAILLSSPWIPGLRDLFSAW